GIARREDTLSALCAVGVGHNLAGVDRADVLVVADFGGTRVQYVCHNQGLAVALRPSPRLLKSLARYLVVCVLLPDPTGRDYQLVVDDIARDRYVDRKIDGPRARVEISTGVVDSGSTCVT